MKREHFYLNGKAVWKFKYKWIDDWNWNRGYNELHGEHIATEKDWKEYWKAEEFGNGFAPWDITKTHANKKEYDEMMAWYY